MRFYTVTELVLKLAEARKNGTLERLENPSNQQDLLILDEWGYAGRSGGIRAAFSGDIGQLRKQESDSDHKYRIFKWGGIFTDEQMAAAMIDRLVHHGHLIMFEVIGCSMH